VTVTVNNAIQPTSIPTLGEWVLLALALSLLGNAGFRMRSRGRDMR
jgi:hypothetical protein